MHAVQFDSYGGPEVLELREIAAPASGRDHALIEVHAVSVNPIDWKMRSGRMAAPMPLAFPAGTGRDGAGIVEASENPGLVGQRVAFFAPRGVGSWAEYVSVPNENIAVLPDSISFTTAAALPLAGTSAWIPLVEIADVGPGTRLLIHAGAGGVGSLAIQIARARGAQVIATCSQRNVDFVRALGANEVIVYDRAPFDRDLRDVDVVFDTMGSGVHDRSYQVLKRGGLMVCLSAEPFVDRSVEFGVTVTRAPILPRRDLLEMLLKMVADGTIRVPIEATLPFSDFRRAHELSQGGHVRGKIVLAIRDADGALAA